MTSVVEIASVVAKIDDQKLPRNWYLRDRNTVTVLAISICTHELN